MITMQCIIENKNKQACNIIHLLHDGAKHVNLLYMKKDCKYIIIINGQRWEVNK